MTYICQLGVKQCYQRVSCAAWDIKREIHVIQEVLKGEEATALRKKSINLFRTQLKADNIFRALLQFLLLKERLVLHLPGLQNFLLFKVKHGKNPVCDPSSRAAWNNGGNKPFFVSLPLGNRSKGAVKMPPEHPVGWCCWQGLPVLLKPTMGTSKEIITSCHHTAATDGAVQQTQDLQ